MAAANEEEDRPSLGHTTRRALKETRMGATAAALLSVLMIASVTVAVVELIGSSSVVRLFPSLSPWSSPFQQQRHLQSSSSGRRIRRTRRILYIVTSLAEYNTGTRATVARSDRLRETTIPVVTEGIRTMVESGEYEVDLFLVCHYTLQPEREALIRAALPSGVGLQVWNDATPLGYKTDKEPFTKLINRTEHLARQHRFVIKDKVPYYDVFVNFEDDMLVTASHVRHFEAVTSELARLRDQAGDGLPRGIMSNSDAQASYHGSMTKAQLRRIIPGFIRVEVLLDEEHYPAQSDPGPIPIDLDFSGLHEEVDPSACCHVSPRTSSEHRPPNPSASQLMLWETHVLPLGVRRMPDESWLGWVVAQRGPSQNQLEASEVVGDYWSNRKGDFYPRARRPAPQEFKYINNQGGWMATREQMLTWHTEICPGGFLPPYEAPHYRFDGLDMRNVEWYSGSMQLATIRHACNMQRIILLDPKNFSKSLLYHTANNKQRQLTKEGLRERFTKANTLLGQLNAVRKRAQADMDN